MKNKTISPIKSGFTLIELLIVLAIIGILSTISLFAISGVRESARDARRKADLETIRQALEMYKADVGIYPNSITFGSALAYGGVTYLQIVPQDPSVGSYSYLYCRVNDYAYNLYSTLEDHAGMTAISPTCSTCFNSCYYQARNP